MWSRLLGSAALGAGASWLLDPEFGAGRRARLRGRLRHKGHQLIDALAAGTYDLQHVLAGQLAELKATLHRDRAADHVVKARLRATLGRYVSHPHALSVEVEAGMARLGGPLLRRELDPLLDALLSVRGVRGLENHMEIHEEAGRLPALQGGETPSQQHRWRPALRLATGLGSLALLSSAFFRRPGQRWPFFLGGGLLLWRSATNVPLAHSLGIGESASLLIEARKSTVIDRPLSLIREFLQGIENYPLFVSPLRSVAPLGGDEGRWELSGRGPLPFTVDIELSPFSDERIFWRSVRGHPSHELEIRLEPVSPGSTRLSVRFSYTPVGGLLGHGLVLLSQQDARHLLEKSLLRLKSLVEIGKTSMRGQTVLWAEL